MSNSPTPITVDAFRQRHATGLRAKIAEKLGLDPKTPRPEQERRRRDLASGLTVPATQRSKGMALAQVDGRIVGTFSIAAPPRVVGGHRHPDHPSRKHDLGLRPTAVVVDEVAAWAGGIPNADVVPGMRRRDRREIARQAAKAVARARAAEQ